MSKSQLSKDTEMVFGYLAEKAITGLFRKRSVPIEDYQQEVSKAWHLTRLEEMVRHAVYFDRALTVRALMAMFIEGNARNAIKGSLNHGVPFSVDMLAKQKRDAAYGYYLQLARGDAADGRFAVPSLKNDEFAYKDLFFDTYVPDFKQAISIYHQFKKDNRYYFHTSQSPYGQAQDSYTKRAMDVRIPERIAGLEDPLNVSVILASYNFEGGIPRLDVAPEVMDLVNKDIQKFTQEESNLISYVGPFRGLDLDKMNKGFGIYMEMVGEAVSRSYGAMAKSMSFASIDPSDYPQVLKLLMPLADKHFDEVLAFLKIDHLPRIDNFMKGMLVAIADTGFVNQSILDDVIHLPGEKADLEAKVNQPMSETTVKKLYEPGFRAQGLLSQIMASRLDEYSAHSHKMIHQQDANPAQSLHNAYLIDGIEVKADKYAPYELFKRDEATLKRFKTDFKDLMSYHAHDLARQLKEGREKQSAKQSVPAAGDA